MKNELSSTRSSTLVSLPALCLFAIGGALAAFYGQRLLAAVLLWLALLAGVSRWWAFLTAKKLSVAVSSSSTGLFPGEETILNVQIHNEKLLPVVWMELFFPLSKRLCIVPEDTREPEEWEQRDLMEESASPLLVGEKRVPFLLWYESRSLSLRWTARRRGIYSLEGWRLYTGDGLGLTQIQCPIAGTQGRRLVVYPAKVDVSTEIFLRNLWNAQTGSRGVMEDVTVIRSTRDYLPTDPVKHINWRLAARGLPLSVNVYEDILPRGAHFLFDGESFGGPGQHWEEMEEALSILASLLLRLADVRIGCGLSLCGGASGPAVNFFAPADTGSLLCALAGYEPMENKWDEERRAILPQKSVFLEPPILENAGQAGRFYYIAYDTQSLSGQTLLTRLGQGSTTICTFQQCEPFSVFETLCLQKVREGSHG